MIRRDILPNSSDVNIQVKAYNSSENVEIRIGKYGGSVFSKTDAKEDTTLIATSRTDSITLEDAFEVFGDIDERLIDFKMNRMDVLALFLALESKLIYCDSQFVSVIKLLVSLVGEFLMATKILKRHHKTVYTIFRFRYDVVVASRTEQE